MALRVKSRTFVGRQRELGELRTALDRARAGEPSVVLMTGEAGIGKTRLVEELVTQVRSTGGMVLIGGCPVTVEGELPFAPVAEAMRGLFRQLGAAERAKVLEPSLADLSRMLPEFEAGPDGPQELPAGAARMRLFESILATLERLAESHKPVLLVLEDLHWSDRSTRELLAFLVRNLRDAGLMLIATYRPDVLPADHPLLQMALELARVPRVVQVEVHRLDRGEVGEQLTDLLGRAVPATTTERVYQRSDGNPFYVEELAAALGDGAGDHVPETLRETVLSRTSGLPEDAKAVLRTAAVAGRTFDPRLLSLAIGLDDAALGEALRQATERRLFTVSRLGTTDEYSFRHALVQEALYGDLPSSERIRLHAAIARVLLANPDLAGRGRTIREAELAHHFAAAGDFGRALPAFVAAGRAAESIVAFPEAFANYRRALDLWDRVGLRDVGAELSNGVDLERLDLIERAAETGLLEMIHVDEAVALSRSATELADPTSDPIRAALAFERLARALQTAGDPAGAVSAVERAIAILDQTPASPERARIRTAYARALQLTGRYMDARVAAAAALDEARATGARSEEETALRTLGVVLASLGDSEGGLAQIAAARSLAEERQSATRIRPRPSRIGDVVREYADLASALDRAGRTEDATAASLEGSARARQLGAATTWGQLLEASAVAGLYRSGRWGEAREIAGRLLAEGVSATTAVRLHVVVAHLEIARGDLVASEAHLEAARGVLPSTGDPDLTGEFWSAAAEHAIWASRLSDARAAVDAGLMALGSASDRLPSCQLLALGLRIEAEWADRARMGRLGSEMLEVRELADVRLAELEALVAGFIDRRASAPRELNAFPALGRAEHSRVLGHPDAGLWELSVAAWRDVGERYREAYARWRLAEAWLGEKGSRARAEHEAREAHRIAAALGAVLVRTEIEALARRARLDLETPGAAGAGPSSSAAPAGTEGGLTPRELEVLALLTSGRTNREIAEALFITEKTAGHHVSNVLAKLNVRSRVEAAAVAHRLGLVDPGG